MIISLICFSYQIVLPSSSKGTLHGNSDSGYHHLGPCIDVNIFSFPIKHNADFWLTWNTLSYYGNIHLFYYLLIKRIYIIRWRMDIDFLKWNILLPSYPAISLLGVYSKELKARTWTGICLPMFTAVLFTIAKSGNNPNIHWWKCEKTCIYWNRIRKEWNSDMYYGWHVAWMILISFSLFSC